jgi:uncharacterized protein with HEPN domain
MSARRRRDRAPKHQRTRRQLLDDIGEALDDAEQLVLSLGLAAFLDDRRTRGLARDILNRVRTAVQRLDRQTLGRMPEFVSDEIADIRNLAIYEYGTDADELVYRTLANSVPAWRTGLERATRADAAARPPTRADGTLDAARPRPLCGRRVASTGLPCLLTRGHRGYCRSILR